MILAKLWWKLFGDFGASSGDLEQIPQQFQRLFGDFSEQVLRRS